VTSPSPPVRLLFAYARLADPIEQVAPAIKDQGTAAEERYLRAVCQCSLINEVKLDENDRKQMVPTQRVSLPNFAARSSCAILRLAAFLNRVLEGCVGRSGARFY
jgi:hypothetical protein